MNKYSKLTALLGLLLLVITFSSSTFTAKDTVIYIVRHAEKDTSDPANNNPDLSAEGKERAAALNEFLKKEKFAAVFSTDYKRTMQTGAPVAQRNGLPLKSYKDSKEIAALVKSEYPNQKILITGHSNTILDIVKALGATPPFDKLNDDDYDLIFMVRISTDGEVSLKTQRFGKSHHSSPLPETKSAP